MDCLSCAGPLLDIGIRLWDCSAKSMAYFHELEENMVSLSDAMNDLRNLNQDVKRRVEFSQRQNLQCTNQVKGWLENVEIMEEEVNLILLKAREEHQTRNNKCLGGFFKGGCFSHKLGKLVARRLDTVKRLLNNGQFDAVSDKLPCPPVDEMPIERTVGLDLTLREVWSSIQNRSVGIIGLYGMGGVGKTTLLKRINNELFGTRNDFDVVIWVVVSNEASITRIQDVFRYKLQIPDEIWNANKAEDRSIEIYQTLRGKKFVLLLDDVWKRFDLLKFGIPIPNDDNGSKVIFTTRSKEVCGHMEADSCIRVECLTQEKALDLFLEKVGKEALNSHPDIPHLAKVFAQECQGLPLALITIGRSMASRKKLEDWKRGIELLQSSLSHFSGIADYVYHLLKFSYDSLPSTTLQSCFLYCSLFPKGSSIVKNRLIDMWIGEGFFDEFDDIRDERRQAEEAIETLKLACLLEEGDTEQSVKMHDVIRNMALWLACDRGQKKNKFLVRENARPDKFAKWKDAERISLWSQEIKDVAGLVFCPKLITLLITSTLIGTFPSELYEAIHALRVLDLSGNQSLDLLPEGIASLKNLQYLNLFRTALRTLPVDIKNQELEVLITKSPGQMHYCPLYDEIVLLEELERLEHMDDICISIFDTLSVQKLLSSSKLQRCIRNLTIMWSFTTLNLSTSSLSRMNLEVLEIWNADTLRIYPEKQRIQESLCIERLRNLRVLVVVQCEMPDMNWLVYAPCLEFLRVKDCSSIKQLLNEDFGDESAFSCLTMLHLQDLPEVKSIIRPQQALAFPVLKEIEVLNCSSLLKLPFDFNSAKESLIKIKGQREWWEKLTAYGYGRWQSLIGILFVSSSYIHVITTQAEEAIETLKLACLLEEGDTEQSVKMHDVIRDMALWLACDRDQKKNKFLVREIARPGKFAKWKDAERISLWSHEIKDLAGVIFASLKNLQYLNLSRTALRTLPVDIKNLKKLRCFLLNDTYSLIDIPREVLSSLSYLQVFSKLQSPGQMHYCPLYDEIVLLEELERLEHMDDICISIFDTLSVQKLLSSSKLQRCIRNLTIMWSFTTLNLSTSSLSRMKHLEVLEIWNADTLRIYPEKQRIQESLCIERLRNLRVLVVVQCELPDMNWLVYAPCLEFLRVKDCSSIKQLLNEDFGDESAFSCLTMLHLQDLPELKSIIRPQQALAFPVLKEIEVMNCPSLMKLPFDFNSAKESLIKIKGQREWLEKLVWDDNHVESFFSSKFVSLDEIVTGNEDSLSSFRYVYTVVPISPKFIFFKFVEFPS
ncbi:disease resistance protein RPS5-like [Humulus lupulus]|uniref:disease resistance protein RPS5-like n=1 Tax=Humulus lupulus TaxID=3486 RepID=UPI002B405DFF|nr:disease resistance protein RPS5-like [Humulus lupulus]